MIQEKKIEAYCVRCKQKRIIQNPKEVLFKGKGKSIRRMLKGTCPVCGAVICRILPSKKKEKEGSKKTNIEKEIKNWDEIT